MRADIYADKSGHRFSTHYITLSAAELDRQSAIALKELPLYRDQAYLDEYHVLKAAGTPALAALEEIYHTHPELAFPIHEHDAVLITAGRRTFVGGEVDDNLVETYICRTCGAEL